MQEVLAAAEYRYLSGGSKRLELDYFYDRYSDFWRISVINELREQYERSTMTVDRASFRQLWASSCELLLRYSLRHIDAELSSRCVVVFDGCAYDLEQVRSLLATEADRSRRLKIYEAYCRTLRDTDLLRQERLRAIAELVSKLGYSSPKAFYADVRQLDLQVLEVLSKELLATTQQAYESALSARLRELSLPFTKGEQLRAHRADSFYLLAKSVFDSFYPAERLLEAWRETMSLLGIKTYAQKQLHISRQTGKVDTFAIGLSIPTDIRFVVHPQLGGLYGYIRMFHVSAKAEFMAHISSLLRPQFCYPGDLALDESYGLLFSSIVTDPVWLERLARRAPVKEVRREVSLVRLARIRYWAALLGYELLLYSDNCRLDAESYSESVSAATGFGFDSVEHMLALPFVSARMLYAAMFAAALKDYLMTRYGRSWWMNVRAGNLLKELWNTGYRYTSVELAEQLGLGRLSFEPLQVELLQECRRAV
ncbi:MAG: hypothetical protein RMM17_12580 [Acidobacteriota bacterium]|nr:hypothetical protein [Blastocatellia bacterium]MDW8413506.1 hypothetical protein [Acidobacteriota bacterium]